MNQPFRQVGNKIIPLTPEEIAEFEARQAEAEARRNAARWVSMREAINKSRDELISAGFSFDFVDGTGTVQTRDADDWNNILGLHEMAKLKIEMGADPILVDEDLSFRDAENVTHEMSPTDILNMAVVAFQFKAAAIRTAHALKDELSIIKELEDYDALETFDPTVTLPIVVVEEAPVVTNETPV